MLPLVEDIALVFGRRRQRRVAALPWHPREPGLDVDRLQRLEPRRVVHDRRAFQGRLIGPGHLLQLERAALADAVLVGVGEAAAVEKHRGDAGRIGAGERALRMRRVGKAHGADLAVAPGLADDPGAGVVAVVAVAQIFDELRLPSRSGRGNPDR